MQPSLWGQRKRESQENEQSPGRGTKVLWTIDQNYGHIVLWTIFTPGYSTLKNKFILHNLTQQVESLVNSIQKGLQDLNRQLQTTSKMILQNRLALDLLLLKEHGICGFLRIKNKTCCIYISNITQDLNKQIDQIKKIA